jgi:hypothetical protein
MEGVQDVALEMEGVQDGAPVMEGVEDVAPMMQGVEDVAAVKEGIQEEVHQFYVLTAGEKVIFDVMFDIHHPNIYLDDNGVYHSYED